MSATNRGGKRRADDLYETPGWCVHRLLEAVDLPDGEWLEPCAGQGAIIHAINGSHERRRIWWTAVELRPAGIRSTRVFDRQDFLRWIPTTSRFAVAITNPPFSLAREFIDHALTMADHVVMLLRLNFYASGERRDFMAATHPDVYVLPNRPSFTDDGRTDATEYAWFHWHANAAGIIRVLNTTPAEERRAK